MIKQRVAAKAVIEADGYILILKPSAIDANRNWHIPGGIRDDINEDLIDTAKREVLEETGFELGETPAKVFKIGEWPAVDKGEDVRILAVFFHFETDNMPKIELSEEHDDYAWVNLSNYKDYPANKEVYEIVEELLDD